MSFIVNVEKRSGSKKPKSEEAKIQATSSQSPLKLTLPSANPTLANLKSAIHLKSKRLHPTRQRITTTITKKALVDDNKTLKELGVSEGDTLEVKDLGPQISWKTVFLIEYAGPIFIHLLFYFFRHVFHKTAPYEPSTVQTLALTLVVLHFVKRELETLYVHRFSNATMPFTNLPKNCFHYWVLGGVFIAYFLYGPSTSRSALAKYSASSPFALLRDEKYLLACTALWAVAELANFHTHLQLMWLRPKGSRIRKIPRGAAFELVSCPNYFFEIVGWTAFSLLTLSPAAIVFAGVGAAQMAAWAAKKHSTYRKEFPDYPRGRKRLIPFIW